MMANVKTGMTDDDFQTDIIASQRIEAESDDQKFPLWCENLRDLTVRSGLTQAEIARRAGLQRDAFGRYYAGKTVPPHSKLIAIAAAFGVKPSDIDPERADLDGKEPERSLVQPPYRLTPATSGKPGRVYLEIAAEIDIEIAADIIRKLTESGTR